MIHYKNRVKLDRRRSGDLFISGDLHDDWKTSALTKGRTLVSDWWRDQAQTDLRSWQKDMVVAYAGDALGPLHLYNIYKPGGGYNQDHDMCLAFSPDHNIWIFATTRDYWITQSDDPQIVFETKDSLGSVLDKESRMHIGQVWDKIKRQANPENRCLWIK